MEYPISSSYPGSITHSISSQKTKASSFQQRTHWAWFIRWRNWFSIISLNYTSHVYDSNFQIMTSLHQLFSLITSGRSLAQAHYLGEQKIVCWMGCSLGSPLVQTRSHFTVKAVQPQLVYLTSLKHWEKSYLITRFWKASAVRQPVPTQITLVPEAWGPREEEPWNVAPKLTHPTRIVYMMVIDRWKPRRDQIIQPSF